MKYSVLVLGVSLFVSLNVFADDSAEMKNMKEFHSGICKQHNNPELCESAVGMMMKSVMQNDDIYFQCSKLSSSQKEESKDCRSATAIRNMINGFN